MALVNLIVALALLQFLGFTVAAGRARYKYGVPAPATTGNEMFERYHRVQMNTLELLILYVPAMWMFGFYVNAKAAAGLGALYIVGRLIYFFAYIQNPKKRELGFQLSAGPVVVLVIGSVIGAAIGVIHS